MTTYGVDDVAPNMCAGSILDLEPDTDYEARFVMTDPDGVTGEASRIVTVRTRVELVAPRAPRRAPPSHGFRIATPAASKSLTLRVATLIPCTSAISGRG